MCVVCVCVCLCVCVFLSSLHCCVAMAIISLRWSKREEQDFVRVISFFGVEFEKTSNRYNWARFRSDSHC